MKIYLIPGLGADRRMYLPQLQILSGAEVLEHLPVVKGETLSDYAKRFIPLIDTASPFVLIGTSLGGIISIELAGILNPEKVILISSVKNRSEMPYFIRSMKYLMLHKMIPGNGFKRFNNLMAKRLGTRGDATAAELIIQMINDTPPEFLKWAINAVIHWHPANQPLPDIIHIHGTQDQLFPISKIKDAIAIPMGTHIMNMTMSREVNKVLLEVLSPLV